MSEKNLQANKKNTGEKSANKMWGGHFDAGPDLLMEQINASISFDKKLYAQDIRGSIAHAQMLAKTGILAESEVVQIIAGLLEIKAEIDADEFEFSVALEDIHMNIEASLKEKIGDVAGKLHTARSRNDQVATAFRLYVRDALDGFDVLLQELQQALLTRAEEYADTIMPGFTHLQVAQPVTFGHHLLAYVEMFARDRRRLRDAREGMNECPLGAAALAGTSFPLDRQQTAASLGFREPTANSLDSVSDRDFALEFLSFATICANHLSRLGEEMVIWSSAQFAFVKLSDAFTSGSSIMPQKRNPDAAELVRAKSGRITGNLISLLMVMKGLTLAYNKDMQEDKEPVFAAEEHLTIAIRAMTGMLKDLTANKERMEQAAGHGYSTATDLADWLVRTLAMPFRQAHHVTGSIVRLAETRNCKLEELSLSEMQNIEPRITENIFSVLSVQHSVQSRTSFGGTAPDNVRKSIVTARGKYGL